MLQAKLIHPKLKDSWRITTEYRVPRQKSSWGLWSKLQARNDLGESQTPYLRSWRSCLGNRLLCPLTQYPLSLIQLLNYKGECLRWMEVFHINHHLMMARPGRCQVLFDRFILKVICTLTVEEINGLTLWRTDRIN